MRVRDLGFASIVLALVNCGDAGGGASADSQCGPTKGVVEYVIDGDTVVLGNREKVRLLMINAPEITGSRAECYGIEAKKYLESMLATKNIVLKYDRECRDKYGRLLAYIEINGRDISALMVERGYARVMHIPPNGNDRAEEFKLLELSAKQKGRGLWGACVVGELALGRILFEVASLKYASAYY